jgi:hypothetical protein
MLMSALAVASNRPVPPQAMPLTLSECAPINSARPTPDDASQILMLPSRPPLASIVPKDMYIRHNTAVWQLRMRDSGAPVSGGGGGRVKHDVSAGTTRKQHEEKGHLFPRSK